MNEHKSEVTGTVHNDECERCSDPLTHENVTEGDLGFYCSEECLEDAECGGSDYDDRANERKQMGLTNF